jgi:hypothetical protein
VSVAAVALVRAEAKMPYPEVRLANKLIRYSVRTLNMSTNANCTRIPSSQVSSCLGLNTRNEIGTKRRSFALLLALVLS